MEIKFFCYKKTDRDIWTLGLYLDFLEFFWGDLYFSPKYIWKKNVFTKMWITILESLKSTNKINKGVTRKHVLFVTDNR